LRHTVRHADKYTDGNRHRGRDSDLYGDGHGNGVSVGDLHTEWRNPRTVGNRYDRTGT